MASGSLYCGRGRIWSANHNGYRAFQTQGVPIRNERGEIERWLGALTDVQDIIEMEGLLRRTQTDLAESLTALRDSQAQSRAYLANLQAVEKQLAGNASALKQLHDFARRRGRSLHPCAT
jgi:DNA repair ATPase RecN